jgi:hypothetical protein
MGSELIPQVDQLISQATDVLKTHRPHPPNVVGFPTLDSGAFTKWQTQTLRFLERNLGPTDVYTQRFRTDVKDGFTSSVQNGIGILSAVKEDLASETAGNRPEPKPNPLTEVEKICERFHIVARQLRSRHEGRPTLSISDEYDVQDLAHAL